MHPCIMQHAGQRKYPRMDPSGQPYSSGLGFVPDNVDSTELASELGSGTPAGYCADRYGDTFRFSSYEVTPPSVALILIRFFQ